MKSENWTVVLATLIDACCWLSLLIALQVSTLVLFIVLLTVAPILAVTVAGLDAINASVKKGMAHRR